MKKRLLLFSILLISFLCKGQCNCNLLGDNFFTGDYNITQAVSGPFSYAFSTDGSAITVNLVASSNNERSFDAIYLPSFSTTTRNYTLTFNNCEATFINQATSLSCGGDPITLGIDTGGTYNTTDDTSFTVTYLEDSLSGCNEASTTSVTLTFTKISGLPSLVNIPDSNFEQALIDLSLDTTLDGVIEAATATGINDLNVSSKNIQSLSGIEAFTSLEILLANDNSISSVDLSQNCNLLTIDLSNNQITDLNIQNGNNTAITSFSALNNSELNCIEVDNIDYAEASFTNIDGQTAFNISCSEDYSALLALYNSTNGASWTNTWDLNANVNTFYGVTLDANNRVVAIQLDNNNLTGTLPVELGDLSNLEILSVFNNELTGTIPTTLGNLINLKDLFLARNQLTGVIPTALGSLSSLERTTLNDNQLTGSIPTFLGSLSNLTLLDLGVNELTGSIPGDLGNLSNLTRLRLSFNELTGAIPDTLGNLTNLSELLLNNNSLSGNIPSSIGDLINLSQLYLSANSLSGVIPTSLGNLSNLNIIELSSNQLTGSIPDTFGGLIALRILTLSYNQLTGAIPSSLGNLLSLEGLQLTNNQLTGTIPVSLGQITTLQRIYIDDNALTGIIPSSLGGLLSLDVLELRNNQLTGEIPVELGGLTNLTRLSLFSNQLTGAIPVELGALSNLELLYLNNNNLTGEIPVELGNLSVLTGLTLNNNQLLGIVPSALGNLTNLRDFSIAFNQFSGTLPSEFGNLTNLRTFYINNNSISGIPSNISVLPNLAFVNISNNDFLFLDFESEFTQYQTVTGALTYAPQNTFGFAETITLDSESPLTLNSLFTDVASNNNTYQWYKDSVAVNGATNPELNITNVSGGDAGVYVLKVNNTIVTGLELESEPITVNVTLSNYLAVTDTTLFSDATGTVDIQLINPDNIRGFQFDVTLPTGFVFNTADLITTDRLTDFQTSISDLGNNTFRVLGFSFDPNTVVSVGDGAIVTLPIFIEGTVAPDQYALDITNVVLSNPSNQNIASTPFSVGVVTVIDIPLGDSNGSGMVDILDLLQTIDFILGNNPMPFVFAAADVNMDGFVNIQDVGAIQDIILNPNTLQNETETNTIVSSSLLMPMENYLLVKDQIVMQDSSNNIEIALVNDDIIRGFQFDINLPTGFTLNTAGISAVGRLSGFIISSSDLGGNNYRVLAFSFSGGTIVPGTDAILTLPIAVDASVVIADYTLPITGVVLSDVNNIDIASAPLSVGTISVSSTLGVDEANFNANTIKMYPNPANDVINITINNTYTGTIDYNLYDIAGKLVYKNQVEKSASSFNTKVSTSQLQNGVYILNIKTQNTNVSKRVIISK